MEDENTQNVIQRLMQQIDENQRRAAAAERLAQHHAARAAAAEHLAQHNTALAAEEHLARENAKFERDSAVHLIAGKYYSTLSQVWTVAFRRIERTDSHYLNDLIRENCPAVYMITRDAAINDNYFAANESNSSRSSSSTQNRDEVFPKDIFNKGGGPHVARLIPASPIHASMYDDVATCALGMKLAEPSAVKQRAIHGSRPAPGDKRMDNTGLKHSLQNTLCLNNQTTYFDQNPCVIIVPILSLDNMKNWNGDGYDAVVMADGWGNITSEMVHRTIVMIDIEKDGMANDAEIEQARVLLEQVLCGLAYSLLIRDDAFLTTYAAQIRADQYFNVLGMLSIPDATAPDPQHTRRVRKVTFGVGRHPDPDPLLLAVKAAVTWSTRHNQRLLAGEEVKEDEMMTRVRELYIEWENQSHRPQSWNDLAVGLGQPNGYCSDAS